LRTEGVFEDIPGSHHDLRLADGIEAPEVTRDEAISIATSNGGGVGVGPGGVRGARLVWEEDVSKTPSEDHLVWAVSFEVTPGTQILDGPCAVPFEAAYALGFIDAHSGEYLSTSEGWLLVPEGTPAVTQPPC
jgi:hypothetical protein